MIQVVNHDETLECADVLIEDGKITKVGADIAADNEVSFVFPRDRAVFELRLRRDLPPELPQYELQLQVDTDNL